MKLKKIVFIIFFCISILFSNYSYGAEFNAESPSVILFNTNTGKILYEKNAYEKMYPASTTKIMTAILVLENCDLNTTITVSRNLPKLPADYITASLTTGEEISINDLLHLLLLMSANDAAIVLAEHISGSTNAFANLMNEKAKEIGCLNTHFVNPNGVHNVNHYSTAYDLCLMANYAMKNDTFRKIVPTISYTVPATNKSQERTIYNTNKLLHKSNIKTNAENPYYYEYTTGIKTGYTDFAKNCLVASAKKDDIEYIAVILGANGHETDDYSQRYSDIKNLFEIAFQNYSLSPIKKANDVVTNVKISNGDFIRKNLNLVLEKNITTLVENENIKTEIPYEINLYEDKLQAPITKGDTMGTVTYTYDGISYTENLLAANNVGTKEQMNNYLIIIAGILSVLLTFVIF